MIHRLFPNFGYYEKVAKNIFYMFSVCVYMFIYVQAYLVLLCFTLWCFAHTAFFQAEGLCPPNSSVEAALTPGVAAFGDGPSKEVNEG